MLEMEVRKELTEVGFAASNKEEVIKLLSDKMNRMGYIEKGFEEAVLAREREYTRCALSCGSRIC
jgi:mannitol/fructose-specific phosphotransferase system IIA component (Ntr-type)